MELALSLGIYDLSPCPDSLYTPLTFYCSDKMKLMEQWMVCIWQLASQHGHQWAPSLFSYCHIILLTSSAVLFKCMKVG